jgi:hypothetical protein
LLLLLLLLMVRILMMAISPAVSAVLAADMVISWSSQPQCPEAACLI